MNMFVNMVQKILKDFVTSHERTELEFYLEYFRVGRNLETESDQLAYITDVLEKMAC